LSTRVSKIANIIPVAGQEPGGRDTGTFPEGLPGPVKPA
jgi:hypothetical protein